MGPNSYLHRDQFAHWFVRQSAEKPDFPTVVLYTDEACFSWEGIFNSHNRHVWAEVNPHPASVHCHQQRFPVNIWAGIVHDFLIGPYLLPSGLNVQIYQVFLEEMLPELLQEISLSLRTNMVPACQGCGSFRTSGVRISCCHLP